MKRNAIEWNATKWALGIAIVAGVLRQSGWGWQVGGDLANALALAALVLVAVVMDVFRSLD
ncbi:hypothetical protein Poly51_06320 [Rubripirellula tenax]|uniref:Uncharacterized protein n=1 Tax=Rubripirellula tenax TaxID=2528015 RepID=A0A5C6FJS6_9BACT|nr:hypothetical protein [Rubripirellula tenax]TWU60357.1 hypothetical protein Poly51_06320 [Rubripirellula tenax]